MASFLNGIGSHPAALLAPPPRSFEAPLGWRGQLSLINVTCRAGGAAGSGFLGAEAGSRLGPAGAGTFGSNREGV